MACLEAGAHDFVTKANMARLAPALEREMLEADGRRQLRAAELALRESEKMFAASFHMGPNPMVIIGSDGRLIEMNQRVLSP